MLKQDSQDKDSPLFGEDVDSSRTRRSLIQYPLVSFFHFFFRTSAIVVYVFSDIVSGRFSACMVTIVLLLSCDFWTVKNVSGRLLVGLRWWNQVDGDGKSHWIFESRKGNGRNTGSTAESQIFWVGLIMCPVFWIFFAFSTIISLQFKWLLVVILGLVLQWANLYGYIRCKVGGMSDLRHVAQSYVGAQLFKQAVKKTEEL